jgi:hypothetical protein
MDLFTITYVLLFIFIYLLFIFLLQSVDYIVVIGLLLPIGIVLLISSLLPTFASHLVIPELIEMLIDLRNLQSLLTYHLVLHSSSLCNSSSPSPSVLQKTKEKNWDAMEKIESQINVRIERIKKYLAGGQYEVWNIVCTKRNEER